VTDTSPLDGTWLPQSAEGWDHSLLPEVRASKLVIHSHSFALSKYRDLAKDVTGTFSIDPTANPKTIDLKSDEIDLSPGGEPVKYPRASVPGIYQLEGDVLTVCFATGANPARLGARWQERWGAAGDAECGQGDDQRKSARPRRRRRTRSNDLANSTATLGG
jgi:uncharacterized protein (TIGR03067 family)